MRRFLRISIFSDAEPILISAPIITASGSATPPSVVAVRSISAPIITASGSATPPSVVAVRSISAPIITASIAFLPRSEWCDQAGDPIVWQDQSGACWQQAGFVPIIVSYRLTPGICSATASVIAPSIAKTANVAMPIITGIATVIAPNLAMEGKIVAGMVFGIGSATPPSVNAVRLISMPIVAATGSVGTPSVSNIARIVAPVIAANAIVIPPIISAQGEIAWDFVADRKTFALSADHAATYHSDRISRSYTSPRRPVKPARILL